MSFIAGGVEVESQIEQVKGVRRTRKVQAERYALLKQLFDQSQQDWSGKWGSRDIETSYEDEFFAVSWTGDHEYLRACAWNEAQEDIRRELNRRRIAGVSGRDYRRARERVEQAYADQIHERFQHKHAGPYANECFVFYKSANLLPPALVEMAPNCQQAFLDAPLHNYLIISRHQPAIDKAEKRGFSSFEALEATPRGQQEIVDLLLKRIYPERCPVKSEPQKRSCVWCWSVAASALLLLAIAAVFVLWEGNRQKILDYFGWVDASVVAEVRAQRDQLMEDYRELSQQRLLEDATRGADDTALASSAEQEEQLARIASAIEELGGRIPEHWGYRPCIDSAAVRASNAPVYLYDITPSVNGLIVSEPRGQFAILAEERLHPEFPDSLPAFGSYSVADFQATMAPLQQSGSAMDCAFYVLLRDGELDDATMYREQRSAVEAVFQIYRPR